MLAFFAGKKTYITAAAAIVVAWYNYGMGNDPHLNDAIQLTFTALIGAFVRSGVANSPVAK